MFLRLFAIAVFILSIGPVAIGHADEFQKRFVLLDAPKAAPNINFNDAQGVTHDLKELQGRFVILNLWATWCQPCVNEMASLNALQNQFDPHQVMVVTLNEDRNGIPAATSFMQRHGLDRLQILVDASGRAPSLLRAHGLPTTFLINPQGMIIGYIEGEADWVDHETLNFIKSKIGP